MDLSPPVGSRIVISHDEADPVVAIPAKSSASRYFGGVFLLCWLGLWSVGFFYASSQLSAGHGGIVLIFWLTGWTLGGIIAAVSAFRILRPTVPETLQLNRNSLTFDSGIPPPEFITYGWSSGHSRTNRDYWRSLFAKRVRFDFDRSQLQTLRLRETEAGNRLTIDAGAQRLDLASQASEIEREWLARVLAKRYALTQVFAGTAS